ncbi:hypothetical protein [Actinoplanes regularis]|uniref:Tetratricopeptide repeat-containing protein n=1 Tax=Actinoplanes regularis TaxID=52697 RepID=A0A239FNW6_9ACTN|nr:hypothetical protein [Actinoplanes regularis]GIE89692.1 hypothetical protein Are01nite_61720 [Actinoplanes regularis]SNS58318.1 hypothetical protein SAMN06264365_118168 [Actinoplanes regularis]
MHEPTGDPSRAAVDALVRAIAERTAARDAAGAARLRLKVALRLSDAGHWGDAIESAEQARRDLTRAGLADDAMTARYLLAGLYSHVAGHRQEIRDLLDELLSAPSLPPALPSRAALLERAAEINSQEHGAAMLLEAADLYRDAGDKDAETRVLLGVLSRGLPPGSWPLVSRLDELIKAGLVPERSLPAVQAELCRLEAESGQPRASLDRARRHPGDHAVLRLREAWALLMLGRHADAEELAEPWAADANGLYFWEACLIVVRSLQARDRQADAEAFLAGHDLNLHDMDDVYFD